MNIDIFKTFSVSELAKASGLSPSFMSRCKSGEKKIPIPRAKAIRDELGCSLADLRPDVFGDSC